MSYTEGAWVIDKLSGSIGTVVKENWTGVLVKFNKALVYRYPELLETALLDIKPEDIQSMIDLALMTGDKEWFMQLTEQMNVIGACPNEC
jgi:hypothetical protein